MNNAIRKTLIVLLFLPANVVWLMVVVFNPWVHKIVLGLHLGFGHAWQHDLRIVDMPKARPWPLSDGSTLECSFTLWLVTATLWWLPSMVCIVMLHRRRERALKVSRDDSPS